MFTVRAIMVVWVVQNITKKAKTNFLTRVSKNSTRSVYNTSGSKVYTIPNRVSTICNSGNDLQYQTECLQYHKSVYSIVPHGACALPYRVSTRSDGVFSIPHGVYIIPHGVSTLPYRVSTIQTLNAFKQMFADLVCIFLSQGESEGQIV